MQCNMTTHIARLLTPPNHSFFLFGPRSTGKTTWLRKRFTDAYWVNLLDPTTYNQTLADESLFQKQVTALPEDQWVIVDEIQRVPALLDVIHNLLSQSGGKRKFAISGSSARKLRRGGGNLLAGRVLDLRFFPLVGAELPEWRGTEALLTKGLLPQVWVTPDFSDDLLASYVTTYLREEIQQEALVRDFGSFNRFLRIAAQFHGEVVNIANIARDAAVARTTVQRYFDTLIDTLVAHWLPAWQPRAKVRERQRAKFYFFDSGIVRALTNRTHTPLSNDERGSLLEGWVFHELQAAVSYQRIGGELRYWRAPSGKEIDFVYTRGEEAFGIEVKSANKWRPEFAAPLNELVELGTLKKGIVVYDGEVPLKERHVQAIPVAHLSKLLWDEEWLKC